ncbi:Filamentous hemagglutinin [bacterium HR36]|nr:Filamentous hemagglutinin [bacterium HR36]
MTNNLFWIATTTGLLGIACVGLVGYSQEETVTPLADPTAFITPEGLEGTGESVPDGAQPVLRGPVHEAYAQPARVKPQPGPVVPKEPPKPIEEIPPDQKPAGENVQWIPGYWFWDEEKRGFLWVSGIWRAVPPGMEWVPGTWVRVEGGWQWVPGYWKPVAQKEVEVAPEPPEPPPLAEPPPAPGPDYLYVPGTWVYLDYRWYWRPGVWVVYRPGWVWTPACYYWTPYGYVFVDGFWDYPFRYRGWLFCPIWVDFAVCYRPGWFWRPCYWVPEPCLTSFLFVHTRRFCFFFGDFYDPFYARSGFVSVFYYRVHRHCYDPVVSYYALAYRSQDPYWLARQRAVTQARIHGTAPRPPRTLQEQRQLLAAAAGDPERQAKLRQLVVAGSISRTNVKTVAVQKLDPKQLELARKSAEETRRVQQQRAELERKLAVSKPEPGKPPARIQPVSVKSTAEVQTTKTPPPAIRPKSELKTPPPITSRPPEEKPTPSKPSEEKAKPSPSKPIEAKPKPAKPIEDKSSPPPVKRIEEKPKPTPSKPAEPVRPPIRPSENKVAPTPAKPGSSTVPVRPTRAADDDGRDNRLAPRPPSEDRARPTPNRPPIEDRGRPNPPRPPQETRPPANIRPADQTPPVIPRPSDRNPVPTRPPADSRPPGLGSPRVVPVLPSDRRVVPERPSPPPRSNERSSRERP